MCKAPERERLFLSVESPENNNTSKTSNFNKFQVRAALSYLAFSLKSSSFSRCARNSMIALFLEIVIINCLVLI